MTTTQKILKHLERTSDILDEILDEDYITDALINELDENFRRLRRKLRRVLRSYVDHVDGINDIRKWVSLAKIVVDNIRGWIIFRSQF